MFPGTASDSLSVPVIVTVCVGISAARIFSATVIVTALLCPAAIVPTVQIPVPSSYDPSPLWVVIVPSTSARRSSVTTTPVTGSLLDRLCAVQIKSMVAPSARRAVADARADLQINVGRRNDR